MFHRSCPYLGFFVVVGFFFVTCGGVQRRDRNIVALMLLATIPSSFAVVSSFSWAGVGVDTDQLSGFPVQ